MKPAICVVSVGITKHRHHIAFAVLQVLSPCPGRTLVVGPVDLPILFDDQIIADYALSRHNLRQIRSRLLSSEAYREMLGDLPRDSMSAQPETMAALLERVREDWGSMRGYAVHIGVRTETVEHLRARLLDGP